MHERYHFADPARSNRTPHKSQGSKDERNLPNARKSSRVLIPLSLFLPECSNN